MVVNAIGHLSEAAFHHPDLSVSYALVVVKLMTHSSKGVTNKDFALAKKTEQVIQWQPGREDEGLEGIPAEARFAYIKYD
jgi:4a-hydroxytetrahydrobiopterin dehydratase